MKKLQLLLICLVCVAMSCHSGRTVEQAATELNRSPETLVSTLKEGGFNAENGASTVDDEMYDFLVKRILLEDIEAAEADLYGKNNEFKFDQNRASETVEVYLAFVDRYTDDELTPEYLFKAADLLRALRKSEEALRYYQQICDDFPDFDKVPHSLFLQGFVYENDLKDMAKAEAKYKEFLSKYPDHDLADDVEFSLQYLGKSPEDIIKQFENTEDGDTDKPAEL